MSSPFRSPTFAIGSKIFPNWCTTSSARARSARTCFQIEPEVVSALAKYDWPGNVRELANVIERAQILAQKETITLDDLPANVVTAMPALATPPTNGESQKVNDADHLSDVERRHVQNVLRQCHDNKAQAARTLGISRRALYRLITKYGL